MVECVEVSVIPVTFQPLKLHCVLLAAVLLNLKSNRPEVIFRSAEDYYLKNVAIVKKRKCLPSQQLQLSGTAQILRSRCRGFKSCQELFFPFLFFFITLNCVLRQVPRGGLVLLNSLKRYLAVQLLGLTKLK